MSAFDLTTNPIKLDPLKPGGKATIVVTATNRMPRAVTARAQKVVVPPTFDAMVKPPPNPQRTFSQTGATEQFPFTIEIPANAQAGSFTTRFDVVDVTNQDDNFGQSAALKVTIEAVAAPPPPPPPKKWWLWVAIAVGVVILGVVLYLIFRPKNNMPDVTGMRFAAADSLLAAKKIHSVRRDTLSQDTTAWKADVVIRQDPKGGSKLKPDSNSVTLVVQSSFTVVPVLKRLPSSPAANKLGLAGLPAAAFSRCNNDASFNELVFLVSPPEGTIVARNTTVTFYVGAFQATQCPRNWRDVRIELERVMLPGRVDRVRIRPDS
jgi:hypothetical protein